MSVPAALVLPFCPKYLRWKHIDRHTRVDIKCKDLVSHVNVKQKPSTMEKSLNKQADKMLSAV